MKTLTVQQMEIVEGGGKADGAACVLATAARGVAIATVGTAIAAGPLGVGIWLIGYATAGIVMGVGCGRWIAGA